MSRFLYLAPTVPSGITVGPEYQKEIHQRVTLTTKEKLSQDTLVHAMRGKEGMQTTTEKKRLDCSNFTTNRYQSQHKPAQNANKSFGAPIAFVGW